MERPGVEPWLRGTLTEVDPVLRAVLHALELAREDAGRWADDLSDAEVHVRPAGLPSVAFHLRHMVRSLDRLLTYAEGRQLDEAQLAALKTEMDDAVTAEQVRTEFAAGLAQAEERVRAFSPVQFAEARGVGRKQLPTTVAGLLVHCADHTQRHSGQMVTTAKVVLAGRAGN
ncbi:DinB superfamily protein [Bryocella elongata]|uniref:DinB superfamily protein n=1 Tax=Bryocella elongata TaxID=863522 RepID=A0A1H5SZU3_9BACT|nr:DinB family protein [Bryocella elongata]SEF56035.1 DinB superfamily protein [Bryocella elongata]